MSMHINTKREETSICWIH